MRLEFKDTSCRVWPSVRVATRVLITSRGTPEMNKTQLLRRAIKNWPGNRTYQRQWLRSVMLLGDRWLLAKYVGRTNR